MNTTWVKKSKSDVDTVYAEMLHGSETGRYRYDFKDLRFPHQAPPQAPVNARPRWVTALGLTAASGVTAAAVIAVQHLG